MSCSRAHMVWQIINRGSVEANPTPVSTKTALAYRMHMPCICAAHCRWLMFPVDSTTCELTVMGAEFSLMLVPVQVSLNLRRKQHDATTTTSTHTQAKTT